MNESVTYPYMRLQVVAAVRSLSDQLHQQTTWGRYVEGTNYYDDLTLNVHILYDDCAVLPHPLEAVPDVLYQAEVPAFVDLERALGPMIQELGEQSDDAYTGDRRWIAVVEAADRALTAMRGCDEGAEQ